MKLNEEKEESEWNQTQMLVVWSRAGIWSILKRARAQAAREAQFAVADPQSIVSAATQKTSCTHCPPSCTHWQNGSLYKYFSWRKNLVFEKNPTNQPPMYVCLQKNFRVPLRKHACLYWVSSAWLHVYISHILTWLCPTHLIMSHFLLCPAKSFEILESKPEILNSYYLGRSFLSATIRGDINISSGKSERHSDECFSCDDSEYIHFQTSIPGNGAILCSWPVGVRVYTHALL